MDPKPPPRSTPPGFDFASLPEANDTLKDVFGGQRAALVNVGFSTADASSIVASIHSSSAAEQWQIVGRMWGLTDPQETQ